MYYCDYHIHSEFSFDSSSSLKDICDEAIKKGLKEIAITDHIDCNAEKIGLLNAYDAQKAEYAVAEIKEEYKDSLTVIYGAEFGQVSECPDIAEKYLSEYDFDFVLGSVHNLPDCPDFFHINYAGMFDCEINYQFKRYLEELKKTVLFGGIDSMAHLFYPVRYIEERGRKINFKLFEEDILSILSLMAERDIALEINVKGFRKDQGPNPDENTVKSFISLGGNNITVGSDAHTPDVVGCNISDGYNIIKKFGLDYISVMRNGKFEKINID